MFFANFKQIAHDLYTQKQSYISAHYE